MKSKNAENTEELVRPILEAMGAYLVEVTIRGERGTKILEVFADTDTGISADELTQISRALSAELDRVDPIPGKYRLEVSSPGLGRPLKLPRQYLRNIGRHVAVTYMTKEGAATLEGIMDAATDISITVTDKKKASISIKHSEIIEACVVPSLK
ncbi:MAG: ribosome maturation factor RimP [Ignavibacteriales bacterium]|nr:ribosome maturation factor RimP [Ignavibacteriales bacterium]